MVEDNPSRRPTMAEALLRYQVFMQSITKKDLELRMWQYRP